MEGEVDDLNLVFEGLTLVIEDKDEFTLRLGGAAYQESAILHSRTRGEYPLRLTLWKRGMEPIRLPNGNKNKNYASKGGCKGQQAL